MPRKLDLTWVAVTNRWRKRYKGKDYFFRYAKGEYQQALTAWQAKKAEVDGAIEAAKPHRSDYEKVLDQLGAMRQWCLEHEDQQAAASLGAQIGDLRAQLAQASPEPLSTANSPLRSISEAGAAIWQDRLNATATQTDQTVSRYIGLFLDHKKQQARAGERAVETYSSLAGSLDYFSNWFGPDKPITSINATTLIEYHSHLLGVVSNGGVGSSRHNAKMRFACLKQFLRHCWEIEVIELPRNLNSKNLQIKIINKPPQAVSVDLLRKILNNSSNRTKLYLLLMINCGFYQKDIGELQRSMVDLKKGTIRKKRHKTKDAASVPEVCYPLWKETLALLKQEAAKSGELVLIDAKGQPVVSVELNSRDKTKRRDCIKEAYRRVTVKLKIDEPPQLKQIRKLGASLLRSKPEYAHLEQLYLGHAAASISDRHYSEVPQATFNQAINWLREQVIA